MDHKPRQVVSLCPDCSACPTVEVFHDHVRIGEDPNLVTLSHAEWNQLVRAVQRGELTATTE